MLKNKWARIATSIASVLVAAFLFILLMLVFGSFPDRMLYGDWMASAKDFFASAFLLAAILSLLHVAYDLFATQKGVGKRALFLGSLAFVGLSCVSFAFFVETVPDALAGMQASYVPLAAQIFGMFAGLFCAKALMNQYFGIGWHEYATPRLIKKFKKR